MAGALTIALDAMGGDHAPGVILDGTVLAREQHPGVRYLLFGDESVLRPAVDSRPSLKDCVTVVPAEGVIDGSMKPSQALRKGRTSSMGLAIQAVADGTAQVAVSAGNTGALMALAKFVLRTLPGIDRPALVTLLPTRRGESAMLDLGANVECSAENLIEFAVMGAAYARLVLGVSRPKVALLNIGTEELKGNDEVKQAAERLRATELDFDFVGFAEGNDLGEGTADVFVTDGFTGNVALKTMEGTALLITHLFRRAFRNSVMSMLGYLLARGGLRTLRAHLDPNTHNGGMFVGLNGLVVKSHGGANAAGIASAISVAKDLAQGDLNARIAEDMALFGSRPAVEAAEAAGS
ncbi:MAG: phosphate acyltransferase PlsX [Alphaproteobacteria bacterium]|nr:phosphate acyltransferase PlsX [Alphaproteobacteria bacterium]